MKVWKVRSLELGVRSWEFFFFICVELQIQGVALALCHAQGLKERFVLPRGEMECKNGDVGQNFQNMIFKNNVFFVFYSPWIEYHEDNAADCFFDF